MTFRIFQSGHRRPQRPRLVSMTRSGRYLGGSLSDNRHSDPGGIFLRKLPDGSRASRPLELLRGDRGRTGQRLDPKICMGLCSRLMNARDELGISLHFSRWPTSAVRAAAAWRSNGRSVRVGIVPLFQVYPVFVPSSLPVLSRVDRSAWCSSSRYAGADPHLVSLCSWNCSSKGRTQLFKHGARPQLNRGKVRMFNYGLARRAGKVHPLPGPW
jgi:hypothetical protein